MASITQYKKKDGSKAWKLKAYLGMNPITNKQVHCTRRGFKTKKEATLEFNRLLLDFKENGSKKTPENTFQEIYELWFTSYQKTVKETTYVATERTFRLHILPTFGKLLVNKIDMKLCQKAVNQWSDKMEHYDIVLQYASKVMDYAIHLDLLVKNPFQYIIRPKVDKSKEKKLKFYTRDQLETVMKYLDEKVAETKKATLYKRYFPEFDRAFFRLLAFTGIRSGEALALDFSDFNFDDSTLTISKTVTRTRTGHKISSPKTKSSNRVIPLDPKTVQIIKRWQFKQKEMLFQNRVTKHDGVFVDLNGKRMIGQDVYQRANRLADSAGLPHIGVHGYRHSHASMLFESGATMKEAQVRLGHSKIEMTMNVYTHVTEKVKVETVDKLMKFADF
jgi:integrase